MSTAILLLAIISLSESHIGLPCTTTLDCGKGTFCSDTICRKDGCTISAQCQKDEVCEYGKINGRLKPACFPSKDTRSGEDFCPGGGAVVMAFDGTITKCDMSKDCSANQVCNPQNGFCCTKLRTCPKPTKTMLNQITGFPIICQFKFGIEMSCPLSGYCETKTGFCCQRGSSNVVLPFVKPFVGKSCTMKQGCDGGASCFCDNSGTCRCQCPSELGYSVASDGKTCQRLRRRLKEKCKSDMECSAAFSECSTGGCRCKQGFQRNGDGGCKPIRYKCPGNSEPIMNHDKPVVCYRRALFSRLKVNITAEEFEDLMNNVTLEDWGERRNEGDSCPHDHYCVAVFDDSSKPGFYQGFCCPTPTDLRPVCPVGEAHETSFYPDYGCNDCPIDYYCHKDGVVTEKSICCPKPCPSMDDIYHNGQCYSTAFYGDCCTLNAQCTTKTTTTTDDSMRAPLECRKMICLCPSGYSHINGQCKRVTCTVGLRGEPSVDRNNELLTCKRSADCSQGQLCDVGRGVCCKGLNRCSAGLEESGEQCSSGFCSNPSHTCEMVNEFKKTRVCCMAV